MVLNHYPDLGSVSYWLCHMGNVLQPIRSATQIWVVMHHRYGFLYLFLRCHFAEKPVVASQNVDIFSQATIDIVNVKH